MRKTLAVLGFLGAALILWIAHDVPVVRADPPVITKTVTFTRAAGGAITCTGDLICTDNGSGDATTPAITIALGSQSLYWRLLYYPTGGTVVACAVQSDSSANNASWNSADVVASQTCTSSNYGPASTTAAAWNYARIHLTNLSDSRSVTVTLQGFTTAPQGAGGGNVTIIAPLGLNPAAAGVSVTPTYGAEVTPTANSFGNGATGCSFAAGSTLAPCAVMDMVSNNSIIEPIRDNLSSAAVGITCSSCNTTQTSSAITNTNARTMKVFVNVTACSSCNFTPNIQNKDALSGSFCPIFLASGAVQPLCASANNGIAAITATGNYVYTVGPGLPAILGISANDVPARDLQIVVTWNSGTSATYTVGVAFVN